jgi:hypothetical protein
VPEPAPIGIVATPSVVLFSQPFCDTQPGVTRGIYRLGGPATPVVPLPTPSECAENYFAIASALGGFTPGDLFVQDFSIGGGNGRILRSLGGGPATSPFSGGLFADNTTSPTFDRVGTL